MVTIQGRTGTSNNEDGTYPIIRTDSEANLLAAFGHARYLEPVKRGTVFAAHIPPGTGQAPGTAIGTTAHFTLANPATSGKNFAILQIMAGYISGTLGAGVLALLLHNTSPPITAPSGGTVITPQNLLVGSAVLSVANCRFNNTVPAAGLMVRAIASLGASLATSVVPPWQVRDDVDGLIVIGPGTAVSLQAIAAAGTSPLLTSGMVWEEVDA